MKQVLVSIVYCTLLICLLGIQTQETFASPRAIAQESGEEGSYIDRLLFSGRWDLDPLPSSPPKHNHSTILDPNRDRLIVFGGGNNRTNEIWNHSNDLFSLNLLPLNPTWNQLDPPGSIPEARVNHAAIYDSTRDRLIVYGGSATIDGQLLYFGDIWELPLDGSGGWAKLLPLNAGPGERYWPSAIYDSKRDRMVVFGGVKSDGSPDNDLWQLRFSDSLLVWRRVPTCCEARKVRYDHTAIYDRNHDQMVIFGGWSNAPDGFRRTNDVLTLDFETGHLQSVYPIGAQINPTDGHSAAYDPYRNRMLVFRGSTANDVWALSLGDEPSWQLLSPHGRFPPARKWSQMVFDAKRDRVLVHAGMAQGSIGSLNTLRFCHRELEIEFGPGKVEIDQGLKPVRLAIMGAQGFDPALLDPETLRLSGVRVEARPLGGAAQASRRDVNHDGVTDLILVIDRNELPFVTGENAFQVEIEDRVGKLYCATGQIPGFGTGTTGGPIPSTRDDDGLVSSFSVDQIDVSSARNVLRLIISLPTPTSASLSLYDLRGRKLASERLTGAESGTVRWSWNLGRSLARGTYYLRLIQGGESITRKITVIE